MGISAGRLRQRIEIGRYQQVKNSKGDYDQTWASTATVWAEVIGLDGREALINQALQGISTYRVTIRWRGDVEQTSVVRYGALELNVRSATDPDGRRERLVILADTQAPQSV